MKLAVLSGKGGTGKTLLSVNLAAAAGHGTYVDCDVEEPNGRLFLKPEDIRTEPVSTLLPAFDAEKCDGCRKCVDFCRFNALIYIREKPKVFAEVCHSCGGCRLVCPTGAIREEPKEVGHLEIGRRGKTEVITGILNPGEASGVPVISAALQKAENKDGLTVIDCPPGSACSVMESVTGADYCLLVAEPTAFGFHNFCMVHELCSLLHKPCGVVINKLDTPYAPLEDYCKSHRLPVLARIPYEPRTALLASQGKLLYAEAPEIRPLFDGILQKIGGVRA